MKQKFFNCHILSMMKCRNIAFYASVGLMFCFSSAMYAQTSQEKPSLPLHAELSLGAGTPFKSMIPVDATIDVNYTFFKKLSLHFVSNASYFIPKEGMTSNYNKAFNIGGGIGYTFLPQKNDKLGDFEVRASVTTTVGSSDFKNTSYNIGVFWYSHSEKHKILPFIGISYSFKDFSNKFIPNYHGAYVTFGVRY